MSTIAGIDSRGSSLSPSRVFSLKGRVAMVTGSSKGIGWAIAHSLAAAGAHVVLSSRDADKLKNRVAELTDDGLEASYIAFDVLDHSASPDAVRQVARERGHLDILVNNAGIAMRRDRATDIKLSDFDQVFRTNLLSCLILSKEAAKFMTSSGWGRIINVSSILGISSRSGTLAYTTSKHALNGMTRVLAADLGEAGITCNAIAPGFVKTDINAKTLSDATLAKNISEHTALKRWAEPREIAGAAVFLASEAASFITGHILIVDGGMTAAVWV